MEKLFHLTIIGNGSDDTTTLSSSNKQAKIDCSPLTEYSADVQEQKDIAAVLELSTQVSKIHYLSQRDHELQSIKLEMEFVNSLNMQEDEKQNALKELYVRFKNLK
jgi:hypothetical protein